MGEVEEKLKDYEVKREGEAEILMLKSNAVFFNPVQVHNRDMSIAILRTFVAKRNEEHEEMVNKRNKSRQKVSQDMPPGSDGDGALTSQDDEINGDHEKELNGAADKAEDLSKETTLAPSWKRTRELKPPIVLEALAASGLRSLRYAREVDGLEKVVALDNDKASVEACKRNIKFNGAAASSKVEAHLADARVYMLTHPKEFDVVDLDPYGSPSIFLDSAVQAVADGGLLMCTATDMAVLCGTNGEVCYSKYGSYPIKGKYCHEMALRILLACIESHANRYKRYIVPVLSVFMDFYIRVFVRVFTSASEIKNAPLKLSYVYQCVGCDSFHLQCLGRTVTKNNSVKYAPGIGPVVPQECSDCGKKFNVGGPIWSAPIHDQDWVLSTLADVKPMKDRYPAYDKITSVLTTISEELHDIPLFFSLHNISGTVKCTSPSAVVLRSAVLNAGYRISSTHVNSLGLKSDAPWDVIWDIMRCWVKNHPIKEQPRDSPGTMILSKSPKLEANFSRAVAALSNAQAKKVKRFLPNPERHWGPKVRAGRKITIKHASLLGPEAVNGAICHEEGKDSASDKPAPETEGITTAEGEENKLTIKRQKTSDDGGFWGGGGEEDGSAGFELVLSSSSLVLSAWPSVVAFGSNAVAGIALVLWLPLLLLLASCGGELGLVERQWGDECGRGDVSGYGYVFVGERLMQGNSMLGGVHSIALLSHLCSPLLPWRSSFLPCSYPLRLYCVLLPHVELLGNESRKCYATR